MRTCSCVSPFVNNIHYSLIARPDPPADKPVNYESPEYTVEKPMYLINLSKSVAFEM